MTPSSAYSHHHSASSSRPMRATVPGRMGVVAPMSDRRNLNAVVTSGQPVSTGGRPGLWTPEPELLERVLKQVPA